VCFDDFNPQQKSLQNCLTEPKYEHFFYDLAENEIIPQVMTAEDKKDEYHQLLAWLQIKMNQGEAHIGVVVPDLQQESRALRRLLIHHFNPSLFNISLGQSLYEFPLIAHALTWLGLDKECTYHQAALILQSPYIGAAKEEFSKRSQYLQDSTLLQKQKFTLITLIQDINSSLPQLASILAKLTPYPPSASPQEWINIFQDRLNLLGFPGDMGLNSENYQCYNRFVALFDEFRQFNLVTYSLSAADALEALTELAQHTIFQAQKTHAPIHISGLLEASGCEFDSLWVMGLNAQSLPQKIRLSAFIPPHLQRNLGMPHSTPERELQFAKQTLERLRRGCSTSIVYSYSQMQGDTPNLACSLITHFPTLVPEPLILDPLKSPSLIQYEEEYCLPLTAEEIISGG
ncbi:MAG: PD-(D/E)XK nuclease family protein, partial [bacterium]|nr:PD-(D/E)XK nuclease family protein [bacterium]